MKFELNRLPDYTDDTLLMEIRRVAQFLGEGSFTITKFSKLSKVSLTTLRRRFGSWPSALEKAGLSHLYNAPAPTNKLRTASRSMTNDEILQEIIRVSKLLDRDTLTTQDLHRYSSIGLGSIRNRFGSIKAALHAAGLSESNHGRRYTDEECFENLLTVWTALGRPPHFQEMNSLPSTVGAKAYTQRWGTWNKALHVFVAYTELDLSKSSTISEPSAKSVQHPSLPIRNGSEKRDIPLGLRYNVLKRDCFKCVLCGNSPALVPGVILHIDHIIPFSKGGKSDFSNLRTLCLQCNLGKGTKSD